MAPSCCCMAPRPTSSNPCWASAGIWRQRYRVIAFDRPGHGWSERKSGLSEAEPARQARAHCRGLRRLGVRHAVIVGHSLVGRHRAAISRSTIAMSPAASVLPASPRPGPGGDHLLVSAASSPPGRAGRDGAPSRCPSLLRCARAMTTKDLCAATGPAGESCAKGFIPLAFRPDAYEANMHDLAVMYDGGRASRARATGISACRRSSIAGDADEIVWTDLHSRLFARECPAPSSS